MRNKNKKFIITIRDNVALALPIIGSRLVGSLTLFLAMWLIAKLGHKEVAAGALISVVITCVTVLVWSPIFATSVFIGNACGARDPNKVGAIMRVNFWLGLIIGIPATILFEGFIALVWSESDFVVNSRSIFQWFCMGDDPEYLVCCFDAVCYWYLKAAINDFLESM